MKAYITTQGSVRGCCGHKHRSIEAAHRCLVNDQAGCQSQGGYTDRDLYEVDEHGAEHLLIQIGEGPGHYVRQEDAD